MQELKLWVVKRQIDSSNIYSLESHIQIKSVKNAHFFKIIGSSTQTTGSMLFLLNYQLLWPMSAKIMNRQRPPIFITLFAKWNLLPTKLLHAAGFEQKAYRKCTFFFAFSWFLVNLPLSLSLLMIQVDVWADQRVSPYPGEGGSGYGKFAWASADLIFRIKKKIIFPFVWLLIFFSYATFVKKWVQMVANVSCNRPYMIHYFSLPIWRKSMVRIAFRYLRKVRNNSESFSNISRHFPTHFLTFCQHPENLKNFASLWWFC